MRAANSSQRAARAGEIPPGEHEEEEEEEEEEDTGDHGEGGTGIPVEEPVTHHNLVPAVVAATAGDFFQFSNEQQWIT